MYGSSMTESMDHIWHVIIMHVWIFYGKCRDHVWKMCMDCVSFMENVGITYVSYMDHVWHVWIMYGSCMEKIGITYGSCMACMDYVWIL